MEGMRETIGQKLKVSELLWEAPFGGLGVDASVGDGPLAWAGTGVSLG